MTAATVLGRYDAAALRGMLAETGFSDTLQEKGFENIEVSIEAEGRALPHALVFGSKHGRRFLLLDACIGEATVRPEFFSRRGYAMARPIELAVVHWVREEDPTVPFAPDRPALPLQGHPGLGVLRQAFRVVTRVAADLGKDGVVSVPKFFHDAAIFFHSRLFLFLDADEQGRFEALLRDLGHLSLGDASLAFARGAVRDARGVIEAWAPSYQVFPLSEALADYLHSPHYAAQVTAAVKRLHFTVDVAAFAAALNKHAGTL